MNTNRDHANRPTAIALAQPTVTRLPEPAIVPAFLPCPPLTSVTVGAIYNVRHNASVAAKARANEYRTAVEITEWEKAMPYKIAAGFLVAVATLAPWFF